MEKKNIIKESIILILLIVPIIIMFILWNKLPDNLPIHWNIRGEADNTGPKYLFILFNLVLYFIFILIPKIDPRKRNYTMFSGSYYKLRLLFTLFFSLFFLLVIYNATYSPVDFQRIIPSGFLFLFAIVGNYMSTIRSNFFVGIRTPWTLSSDKVWRETHLIAGRLMFFGGISGGIISLFINTPVSQYFAFILLIVLLLIPVLFSYIYFKRLQSRGELS